MNKTEINNALRKYAQDHLSPSARERELVTKIYTAIQAVLGTNNCLQIGSYPRFTAITPLHDLDVLFKIGVWPGYIPNPAGTLMELGRKIQNEFENPTGFQFKVELNTHSITVSFLDKDETFLSVDIVPAYTRGTNEFDQDTYMVPEITYRRHAKRRELYDNLKRSGGAMNWIQSDPRGYIEVAYRVNDNNADFRKSVKTVKGWKCFSQDQDENFKLKSFHLEQVITDYFVHNSQLDIYDALLVFFENLPAIIERPKIPDRADSSKYIDAYLADLTTEEKRSIIAARDTVVQKLGDIASASDIEALFRNDKSKNTATYAPAIITKPNEGFVPRSPWVSDAD